MHCDPSKQNFGWAMAYSALAAALHDCHGYRMWSLAICERLSSKTSYRGSVACRGGVCIYSKYSMNTL